MQGIRDARQDATVGQEVLTETLARGRKCGAALLRAFVGRHPLSS